MASEFQETKNVDRVITFVKRCLGHWDDAILHLGARRAESSTRDGQHDLRRCRV